MSLSSLTQFPARLLGGAPRSPAPRNAAAEGDLSSPDAASRPERLIRGGRYALVLRNPDQHGATPSQLAMARKILEQEMAMVPDGETFLSSPDLSDNGVDPSSGGQYVHVQALYVDRCAVTNEQYARFVRAGGYNELDLWPSDIWPDVLHFVDRTSKPGPRFWSQGTFSKQLADHPVVGVCWYEASAFARWTGKQLLTPAQWQRAGGWHSSTDARQRQFKYPWGNTFDPSRANTWSAGKGTTVGVQEYYQGCTPNGIYQLVGNTWEWVDARFGFSRDPEVQLAGVGEDFGEIRGGAFDTYLDSQATLVFRSGQPLKYRGANVSFRCAVELDALPRR